MTKLTRKQNINLINHFVAEMVNSNAKNFNKNNKHTHVHMDSDGVLDFDKVPTVNGVPTLVFNDPNQSKYLKPSMNQTKYFRRAYTYVTHHTGKLTLSIVCHINGYVAYGSKYPGQVTPVYIHQENMKFQPKRQSPKLARAVIHKYTNENTDSVHRAIHIGLQIIRHQLFYDGNRRTAWVTCNYYLLQHHDGFLNINHSQAKTWNKLRNKFYNSGNMKPVTDWLIKNCLYTKVADK